MSSKAKKMKYVLITVIFLFAACKQQIPPQRNFENSYSISDLYRFGYSDGFSGWNAYTWEYEDAVYYVSTNDDIMKWTVNSGSVKLLENVSEIGGILISENWLYYFIYGKPMIYRIHLDNGLQEVFFNAEGIADFSQVLYYICGFTLYNDALYIMASTSCFGYDLTSGELFLLHSDISSGAFLNNKLYYVEHAGRTFSIYEKNLKSGITKLVRGDGLPFEFGGAKDIMYDKLVVVNNNLFYSERVDGAVYLYIDGGDDILIRNFCSDEEAVGHVYLETDNQYLYFTHKLTNILYRYDPDKGELALISAPDDFKSCYIYCVLRGVLYYRSDDGNIKAFPLAV